MKWLELNILPKLEEPVLIWHDDRPRLARRVESRKAQLGWEWEIERELGEGPIFDGGWSETVSPAGPYRWMPIPPMRG